MSPVELHRAWMVPPWAVKQGGCLNIPGGTTALLTWQYLLPQELSKRAKKKKWHLPFGDGIAFLIASIWNAVCEMNWWVQLSFCDQLCHQLLWPFIWIPKMASFDLPQDCRNFQAYFCLFQFSSPFLPGCGGGGVILLDLNVIVWS